jgi:predicted nucleotidyltransferase
MDAPDAHHGVDDLGIGGHRDFRLVILVANWWSDFTVCFVLYNPIMERKRSLETFLTTLRQQKKFLTERYGVESLEVFGSYVRGEQKTGSDLDVLVTFREEPSLLTFIRIENYLSDALGIKVDLVMKDSLKPAIGKNVLREAVAV